MKALTKIVWLLSSLLFIVALFYIYSLLPETVGLFFDQNEIAEVYIRREIFFNATLGTVVLLNLLLLGISRLIYQLPLRQLFIPKKAFWTSDQDHILKAKDIISRGLILVSTVVNFLLLITLIMIFDLNASFFDSGQPYPIYLVAVISLLILSMLSILVRLAYPRLDIVELSTYSGSRS